LALIEMQSQETRVSDNIPDDLKYTKSHEWVRSLADGQVEVGISDHAQQALGDLVFVEIPQLDAQVTAGAACAVVESVKAASDVYSPVTGRVTARNEELVQKPELLNSDPYGAGWLMRVRLDAGAAGEALLNAREYAKSLKEAE
jgi:glycine cleavage system H protein